MEERIRDHGARVRRLAQVEGVLRVLVVPIIFTDHEWRWFPDVSVFEEIFNGQGIGPNTRTGSVADWFDANSYGNVRIEATVANWTVSDNTEQYYSFNKSGLVQGVHKAWYPAFDRLEAEGFDFSKFDMDGDGTIDNLVLLHSGYPAEVGGLDCYNHNANFTYRIWAHASTNEDNWESERHGVRAHSYAISSALRGRCHQRPSRISILIHEYIHTFGIPDLVDWAGDWIGKGVGNYDVMANAHGRNGAQEHPAHLSPWSRRELGWNRIVEITEDGEYRLNASETSDTIYLIRHNFPTGEFLLIENRQPILWDQLLWGGGLLIWHIDQRQSLLRYRGHPTMPGWPGNSRHYGLAIAQADGTYDLEMGHNSGDDGDYFRDGAEFGPGPTDAEATSFEGYPNTNSYQNGNIVETGVRIYDVSESAPVMTFKVSGIPAVTGSPTLSPPPSPQPSSSPTEKPTTMTPTGMPSTSLPSSAPSNFPSGEPTVVAASGMIDEEKQHAMSVCLCCRCCLCVCFCACFCCSRYLCCRYRCCCYLCFRYRCCRTRLVLVNRSPQPIVVVTHTHQFVLRNGTGLATNKNKTTNKRPTPLPSRTVRDTDNDTINRHKSVDRTKFNPVRTSQPATD